ncbi:MAG: hypothetical protein J7518_21310 [Nocardioidaceae bacterium]|nr:hypothetical protein [Nocardioidaceae bacterium]
MKNAAWFVLLLCLAGGALGGCSSADDKRAAHEPREHTWSRQQAVGAYRAAMQPVTRELEALAAMPTSARLEQTRAALRTFARASEKAAGTLRAGSWDVDLRTHVDGLVAALTDQAEFLDELAAKPDLAAVRAAAEQSGRTLLLTRTSAAAVEKDLGIGDRLLDLAASGTS